MSGGSYNYFYCELLDQCCGQMHDDELDVFVKDFALVLKDLEYWQSSDKAEKEYRERVNAFKDKWFGRNGKQPDKSYEFWKESYEVEVERNAKFQQQLDRASAPEYEYREVRSYHSSSRASDSYLDEYLKAGYEFVRASEFIPPYGDKAGYIEYILKRKKDDSNE